MRWAGWRSILSAVITTPTLTYRTIDPVCDADLLVYHQRDACIASFGDDSRFQGAQRYLAWLRAKVEEFPEGFLWATIDGACVGQLELEVPYGMETGYVNLFYVTERFRGMGFAPLLHERAELYFRSWEASRIELHVSPRNQRAVQFYRKMGYARTFEGDGRSLWKMYKQW